MVFAVPSDHWDKPIESIKRNKSLELAGEVKKTIELQSYGDTNYNLYSHQKLVQGLRDLDIRGRVETIQTTASIRILSKVLEN